MRLISGSSCHLNMVSSCQLQGIPFNGSMFRLLPMPINTFYLPTTHTFSGSVLLRIWCWRKNGLLLDNIGYPWKCWHRYHSVLSKNSAITPSMTPLSCWAMSFQARASNIICISYKIFPLPETVSPPLYLNNCLFPFSFILNYSFNA